MAPNKHNNAQPPERPERADRHDQSNRSRQADLSGQPGTASLLRLAKSGDPDAAARLIAKAAPLVRNLLRRVPAAHREDTEQELYVRILQAIRRFRPDGSGRGNRN